ncbi:MAG: hypothetical protein FJ272_14455, partial [Planctomycetes bacterium]|nr:hypothetical protein [Planctomycetota bacterium]
MNERGQRSKVRSQECRFHVLCSALRTPHSALYVFACLVACASPAFAVSTLTWTQSTAADFEAGKLDGVATLTSGEVRLAPAMEAVKGIAPLYVWALARDSKGNLYVGTGDTGVIYKVTPDGKASEFHKTGELHVHSLAVDKKDNLYAGTSPHGLVLKIAPDGKASKFFESKLPYVWALCFDSKGNLLASTGDKGLVYRISPQGEAKELFKSGENHILTLALDASDTLYAGSEPSGIVYKITADGKTSVLYDAAENEVHCLALDKAGNLYVGTAASGAQPGAPSLMPPMPPPVSAQVTVTVTPPMPPMDKKPGEAQAAPSAPPAAAPPTAVPPTPRVAGAPTIPNAIYRIRPNGDVTKMAALDQTFIFSLSLDPSGNLLAGTGNKGLIYRFTPDFTRTTLADHPESQVLALLADGQMLYSGTGNMGVVRKLSQPFGKQGTLESSVRDATLLSKWGHISWKADLAEGAAITLATRSGNTQKPDGTWSAWSAEYKNAAGEPIQSPPARFIQYRATLTTVNPSASPTLHEVTIAYLPRNQAPAIESVTIGAQGPAGGPDASKGPPPGPVPALSSPKPEAERHSPAKQVSWKASDPNADKMRFTLAYKALDEKNWKTLKTELDNVTNYSWDTSRVPDGRYQVKVTASDVLDNPPASALTADKISQPFLV